MQSSKFKMKVERREIREIREFKEFKEFKDYPYTS